MTVVRIETDKFENVQKLETHTRRVTWTRWKKREFERAQDCGDAGATDNGIIRATCY